MRVRGGVVVAMSVLAACSGTAETTSTATTSTTAREAPTTEPEPIVESIDLEGFETRSVVFGNVEVEVTAVRTSTEDLRSFEEGGEPVVGDGTVHAILDIAATNLTGRTQIALGDDAFRLRVDGIEIAGAESLSFLSEVGSSLRPQATVESFLAFPVEAGVDLSTATLVVGASPDRPAELPLSGPVPEPTFPVTLELEGEAEGTGPTNGGTYVFTLLEATLAEDQPHEDANSPTGIRADEGELFLVIHVRAEKIDGRGNDGLADAFRLIVDGTPTAPWDVADDPTGSASTPTGTPGAAVDAWVAFLIAEDVETAELQVGHVDEEPGLIPLNLDR